MNYPKISTARPVDLPAVDSGRDWVILLARMGYAARGVVYVVIGGLATLAALGEGGQTTDSKGALASLMSAPLGKALLALIAVGLLGHSMWRGVQMVLDPDRHGTNARGLAVRAGLGVSAVVHFSLALFSLGLVFAIGVSGGSNGSESLAGWLLDKPFGRLLVGAVGLAVAGAGVAHVVKGWHARFDRYLNMAPRTQRWAYPICRFGLVVRGFVLVIIGGLFLTAAVRYDPQAAGGLTDMFATVRDAAYGRVLFLAVAVGLLSFGVYSLIEAVYRRIRVPG